MNETRNIMCLIAFFLCDSIFIFLSHAVFLPPRCVNQVHARSSFVNMNHCAHTHLDTTVILHVEKNRNDNVD